METEKKLKPKSVRLDEQLAADLSDFCAAIGIPEAFMVRRFIRAGLKSQNRHALLLEADELQRKAK